MQLFLSHIICMCVTLCRHFFMPDLGWKDDILYHGDIVLVYNVLFNKIICKAGIDSNTYPTREIFQLWLKLIILTEIVSFSVLVGVVFLEGLDSNWSMSAPYSSTLKDTGCFWGAQVVRGIYDRMWMVCHQENQDHALNWLFRNLHVDAEFLDPWCKEEKHRKWDCGVYIVSTFHCIQTWENISQDKLSLYDPNSKCNSSDPYFLISNGDHFLLGSNDLTCGSLYQTTLLCSLCVLLCILYSPRLSVFIYYNPIQASMWILHNGFLEHPRQKFP